MIVNLEEKNKRSLIYHPSTQGQVTSGSEGRRREHRKERLINGVSWKGKAVWRSQGCIVFRFLVNVHFKKTKTLRSDWLDLIIFFLVALFILYSSNAPSVKVLNKVDHEKLQVLISKGFQTRNDSASLHIKNTAEFEYVLIS